MLDRHAAVAANFASQICNLNPIEISSPESPDEGDEKPPPPAEGAVVNETKLDESPPGYFSLPYSRASLKSSKDHAPKMHAGIKIKSPEEAELVRARNFEAPDKTREPETHDTPKVEGDLAVKGGSPVRPKTGKQTRVYERNFF